MAGPRDPSTQIAAVLDAVHGALLCLSMLAAPRGDHNALDLVSAARDLADAAATLLDAQLAPAHAVRHLADARDRLAAIARTLPDV